MAFTPEDRKHAELFHPYSLGQVDRIEANNIRFVHYTSADAAVKILNGRSIWLRQTTLMNDRREVEHGLDCLRAAYQSSDGQRLRDLLNSVYPGITGDIEKHMNDHWQMLIMGTFVACFSEHGGTVWDAPDRDHQEDVFGRLSMWRAYGRGSGVALVLNNRPLMSPTQATSILTGPVAYMLPDQMVNQFKRITDGLEKSLDYLKNRGRELTIYSILSMMETAAVSTKHPGFIEEREWRAISLPRLPMKRVEQTLATIGGIPQHVQSIRLQSVPEEGLIGLDPADLISRVIIGPTDAGPAIYRALWDAMAAAGIADISKKLFFSDLPLRGPISVVG